MSIPQTDARPQGRNIRHTHWCWMSNEVYIRFGAQLGYAGIGCYMALARFANSRGQCWPSLEKLCADTSESVEDTCILLERLVTLGLITMQERPGRSPLFTLLPLAPASPSAVPTVATELTRVASCVRASEENQEQTNNINISLVLSEEEQRENKLGFVPSQEEQPEQKPVVSSGLVQRKDKTNDETSPWEKPAVAVSTDQRPDDALEAFGVTPEQREALHAEALRRMAQQGKHLLEEGGWETASTVHCLMCDIFEEWQASAPPCCPAREPETDGCIHEHAPYGVCNDCGEVLTPQPVA